MTKELNSNRFKQLAGILKEEFDNEEPIVPPEPPAYSEIQSLRNQADSLKDWISSFHSRVVKSDTGSTPPEFYRMLEDAQLKANTLDDLLLDIERFYKKI
jgi:hypothetical protein